MKRIINSLLQRLSPRKSAPCKSPNYVFVSTAIWNCFTIEDIREVQSCILYVVSELSKAELVEILAQIALRTETIRDYQQYFFPDVLTGHEFRGLLRACKTKAQVEVLRFHIEKNAHHYPNMAAMLWMVRNQIERISKTNSDAK